MSRAGLLWVLLLPGCNGGGGDGPDPNLTICSGYTAAFYDGVIYVPEFVDTKQEGYESRFGEQGRGFRKWAGVSPADTEAPTQIGERQCKYLSIRVHLATPEQTFQTCKRLGSEPGSTACTDWDEPDGYCHVYISPEHSEFVWGHEAEHCLSQGFHP